MFVIESKPEYYSIVESLAEEFESEIRTGGTRDVAAQSIATFRVMDGEPVVYSAAEYHGENIDCLDERLNPYDVFEFSDRTRVPEQPMNWVGDPAASRAIEVLVNDLLQYTATKGNC